MTSRAPHADDRHHEEGHPVLRHVTTDPAATDIGEALPCREHPADLWFAELPTEVELAKSLCEPCPLREQCLSGALERGEPWGVWGGKLVLGGVVVARKRPRGRPRKDRAAA